MVMEAPPSPQSVGREFVRQYYTLLNKAPNHLHRFYNHQSSFVHGGLDPPNRETSPVIGQKQIHQKIQQLNFHDCHAKITQVDSQATLGSGVVVQVTGELSNAGQPMRRFTQTFVLAAQTPKKYYVHNDIFRYQDEIISDEECEPERLENEDDVQQELPPMQDVQPQLSQPNVQAFYTTNPVQPAMQPPVAHMPPHHVMANQAVPTVNGAVHPEEISVLQGGVPLGGAPVAPNLGQQGIPTMPESMVVMQTEIEDNHLEPQLVEDNNQCYDNQEIEQEPQEYSEPAVVTSNEPKTYANLLKSGNSPYSSPPQATPQTYPRPNSPVSANTGFSQNRNSSFYKNNSNRDTNRPGNNTQQPRIPRQDSIRTRNSFNEEGSDDRRRTQSNSYSDANQLFLGNLPHIATDDDLRDIFGEFGAITDLRVHSKPPNKAGPPGTRAPRNYGFVTYADQQGVQNCLAAKPIFFPKEDKNGTMINVEEKKVKDRQPYGGRPMNENRNRDNNGIRRGPPGGPNHNSAGGPPPSGNRPSGGFRSSGGGPPSRPSGGNSFNRR